MKKQKVIVLSYVPIYNRQGVDLARALRGVQADVALYQLQGTDDLAHDEHGIAWTTPRGTFSKFHVLWNILKFVVPTIFRQKDIVICVGRPILIAGAMYKKLFGCRLVYYALEYSQFGRIDRWAIRQCDRYLDVEENRCQRVVEDYGLSVPTLIVNNMPPLHEIVKGGALKAWLAKEKSVSSDARIVIFTGSYQRYACLQEIIEASRNFPADTYLVLMTYNLPEQLKANLPRNCFVVPPVSGDDFYDWLADADIALLPYESDSDFTVQNCSPQKLFDCYLAGTPYLASNRPLIMKTLSVDVCAGHICNFNDVEAIRSAIAMIPRKTKMQCNRMYSLHCERFNYGALLKPLCSLLLE